MGAQFACELDDRRLLIQQPGVTLNGIDFVEVLDDDAPAGTPRQQTLLVRLFRVPAAPIDAARVTITGGVRVTPVKVAWVAAAPAVAAPGVTPAEAAFYAAVPAADRTLVVRTTEAGDFSPYQLAIAAAPGPAADFDPILSRVELWFKAACPTPFDCGDVDACEPAPAPGPRIDYLAKDYASFRRVMLDRLAEIAPGWRERNPADVGITMVELVAYAADHLSYYQDAVATEAYLATARRRISVRRHARLVDYAMHEGINARTWVQLATDDDDVLIRVADRPRFFTRCGAPAAILPAAADGWLTRPDPPEVFEPLHDVALYAAHDEVAFYTWGQRACCLPGGATRATLRDTAADRLRLRAGDVLIFEQVKGGTTGRPVDADPTRRCAVRLTRVTPEATLAGDGLGRVAGPIQLDPLTGDAVVEIEWHADDALAEPMCISALDANGVPFDGVTIARGNLVLADHGRTVTEPLPAPEAAARRFRPRLARPAVVHAAPYDHAAATDRTAPIAARATVVQTPRDGVAAVTVTDADGAWRVRPTLLASDRFDRHVVVEIDDDRRGHLRFGDGVHGRQPTAGVALAASYRIGVPGAGVVGADAIGHVVTTSTAITRVRNPLPAAGGVAPESTREVKANAPHAFRVQERAVTEADYAAAARRHPEVTKAVATRRWTGSWYTTYLAIDRRGGLPIDDAFRADLRALLERYRLAGHEVEIEAPIMVALELVLPVCVRRGYHDAHVVRALYDRLLALFHPDKLTFAQPIYLSQVIAAAMAVPGVEWIDMTHPAARFQRWGEPANGELAAGVIELARLEIARLDNSANAPEHGRLAIELLGGRA